MCIVIAVLLWAQTMKTQPEPEGLGPKTWEWTGNAVAMGGLIGRQIGIGIQKNASAGGKETSARCSSIVSQENWKRNRAGARGVVEADITSLRSWRGVARVSDVAISEAADMGAILTGVAITLIPNFSESVGTVTKMVASLVTFDFSAMLEILRIMFAITLAGTAVTIILTVAFMILESIVIAALTIGLMPIIACMWMWDQTKNASKQALAALLYAIMSLTTLGVTLEVSYLAVERSIGLFTAMTLDKHYPKTAAMGTRPNPKRVAGRRIGGTVTYEKPGIDTVMADCGLRNNVINTSKEKPYVESTSMYEAYKVYLCLHNAPTAHVEISESKASEEKKRNQFPYESSSEGENVYKVPASRVAGESNRVATSLHHTCGRRSHRKHNHALRKRGRKRIVWVPGLIESDRFANRRSWKKLRELGWWENERLHKVIGSKTKQRSGHRKPRPHGFKSAHKLIESVDSCVDHTQHVGRPSKR